MFNIYIHKSMGPTGKIIIYYGKGEGKTTASLGRAIRMAGHDKKVIILQFMKGRITGEYRFLNKIQNKNLFPIRIYCFGPKTFLKTKQDYKIHQRKAQQGLAKASQIISKENCNLLILDEILYATQFKLIESNQVLKLIQKREKTNIILTGRKIAGEFKKIADQITRMDETKHYFKSNKNIKGLDY